MRCLYLLPFLIICNIANAQRLKPKAKPRSATTRMAVVPRPSPLAKYDKEWNNKKYLICNTAKSALYMTQKERDIIYILNLMRSYPKQFAQTVLAAFPGYVNRWNNEGFDYHKTLMDTLLIMQPVNILQPDNKCFQSALCQASSTGKAGVMGHDRITKECKAKSFYYGECIDYGNSDPLSILMHLMIDEGVPSLGHRRICISPYTAMGVSIQSHTYYNYCAVLDFR